MGDEGDCCGDRKDDIIKRPKKKRKWSQLATEGFLGRAATRKRDRERFLPGDATRGWIGRERGRPADVDCKISGRKAPTTNQRQYSTRTQEEGCPGARGARIIVGPSPEGWSPFFSLVQCRQRRISSSPSVCAPLYDNVGQKMRYVFLHCISHRRVAIWNLSSAATRT